ncbi:HlyD family secretion protein [Methylomarinovum caldicuralii]|uniref:HlyD family secretion protein n=1 Tax=Methylomarinovum caldicuralii TaxID=438856 RepID=A0AAU9C3Q7_9GAMM|nr:HlyD family efflux transporter periplasmic adaptor subunit [Methylomarinovum caldicuralii]BCX81855.1 HlyD family secretion protein [Methylomarinovum caldicuralii]
MKLDRRYWPWVILSLGAGVFLLLVLTRPRQEAPPARSRIWQVEALTVNPRTLSPVLTLYGKVENPALMRVTAPAASQVQALPVREGERVRQGQPLVRLDPRDFEPRVLQARAGVAELEAQMRLERERHASDLASLAHERKLLELLRDQVKRLERLRHRNLSSAAALDQARMEVERQALALQQRQLAVDQHAARIAELQARLDKARAELAQARLALERSQVDAPYEGVVAQVAVAEGDMVQPHQLLLSLYPLAQMEVRAKVPAPFQKEIAESLTAGREMEAHGESLGHRFRLRLRRLAGQAEAGGIDALLEVVSGAQALRINMPATVHLQRPPQDGVVPIPYTALYGNDLIYRIVEGRLRATRVTFLGDWHRKGDQRWSLVRSPDLNPGDLVLVTHLPDAADGMAVTVKAREEVD